MLVLLISRPVGKLSLTSSLLRAVSGNSTDDRVLLADHAVHGALSVALDLGSLVLGLASSVLLLARLLPGSSAGNVADNFNDVSLGAVELAVQFAIEKMSVTYIN
jgi:hypothetical protein